MEKEPTLEELISRIDNYSAQISRYEEMSNTIGTDNGPEFFNARLVPLADRFPKLGAVGKIRKLIAEEVIPEFQKNIVDLLPDLEKLVTKQIMEQIGEASKYLTGEELELVKPTELLDLAREYRRGLITPGEYAMETRKILATLTTVGEPSVYTTPAPAPEVTVPPVSEMTEEPVIKSEVPEKLKLLGNNQVELDGVIKTLSGREYAVLAVLYKHAGQEVITRNLSREALNNPDPVKAKIKDAVTSLREKLGQDLIVSKMAGSKSSHKLNTPKVEVEEELALTEEEKLKNLILEIQRLADSGVLINRQALERVAKEAEALGFSFNLPEIPEELELVELKPEEIEFDGEEAAVLARLVVARTKDKEVAVDGKSYKLDLTDEEEGFVKRLVASWDGEIKDPEKMRESVLTKLEVLFRAENADDLVLKFEGDLGELLLSLFYMDRLVTPSKFFDFLRSGLKLTQKEFNQDIYGWIKRFVRAEAGEVLPTPTPRAEAEITKPRTAESRLDTTQKLESEKISRERKKYEGPFFFPDGQTMEDLTKTEREVAEIFKEIYLRGIEKVVSGEEMFRTIWGENTDLKTGLNRLRPALSTLKKKLPKDWNWENKGERGTGGLYRFIKTLENQVAIEPVAQPAIVEEIIESGSEVLDVAEEKEITLETEVEAANKRAAIVPEQPPIELTTPRVNEREQKIRQSMIDLIRPTIAAASFETWPEKMTTSSLIWHIKNKLHRTIKDTPIRGFVKAKFIHPGGTKTDPEFSRQDAIIAFYLNSLGSRIHNLSDYEKRHLSEIVASEYKAWEKELEKRRKETEVARNGNGHK